VLKQVEEINADRLGLQTGKFNIWLKSDVMSNVIRRHTVPQHGT